MTIQQITTRLLSSKRWPFYLTCIIALMSEIFTAIMNSINSMIWWKRIDAVKDYQLTLEFEKLKTLHANVQFHFELFPDLLNIKGSPCSFWQGCDESDFQCL